jgi:hypothetical protein
MATLAELIAGLQCPRCGHDDTYVICNIERTERVGNNTLTIPLTVGECTICGEQALDDAAMRKLFDAVQELRNGNVSHLVHMGDAYRHP